jgi:hypothetical protein
MSLLSWSHADHDCDSSRLLVGFGGTPPQLSGTCRVPLSLRPRVLLAPGQLFCPLQRRESELPLSTLSDHILPAELGPSLAVWFWKLGSNPQAALLPSCPGGQEHGQDVLTVRQYL